MIGVGVCGGGVEELIGSAYNVSATFFFYNSPFRIE